MVIRKPLELPPALARVLVEDREAREKALRLSDVKQMFAEMKGIVSDA